MPTICEIQTCINNLTTACDAAEFAILATQAVRCTVNNLSFHVATVADLPDLLTANIPNGQMVFVASLGIPVVASKYYYEWRSMDGRLVRKDGVASVLSTWGSGNDGRLGNLAVAARSSPGPTAGGGTNWCEVSAGGKHTAAIKTDGALWTWGCNNAGQLGNLNVVVTSSPGTISGGGTTWCLIDAGYTQTAAVKTDGTAWTWGSNSFGQLGDITTVARSSPGTLAGGGTTWCRISSRYQHSAAIKTDGTLWTWGNNACGRLGDSTVVNRSSPGTTVGGGTTWCAVNTGFYHTAAMKTDGTAWTWGLNSVGQLGTGAVVNRSSPGTTVGGGTNWRLINAGGNITQAIKTDGTTWTWGCNGFGQLGDGTAVNKSSPVTLTGGGTTWCQIRSGTNFMAAIKTDGTAWTWGLNGIGQLGDLTVLNRSSPVTLSGGGTAWCSISAGQTHTAAICLR